MLNNIDEKFSQWKYYNRAVLPSCKPHEVPDAAVLSDKNIWKNEPFKKAMFVKYTTDWDCQDETGWYWVIKDSPLDLLQISSKHRYEIRKGLSHFEVRPINPVEYPNELYNIAVDTLETYPKVYRQIPSSEKFIRNLPNWKFTFGAFDKESNALCGYIIMVERDDVLYYSEQRVLQQCEKKYINAALVYGMIEYYRERLEQGAYIVDGERNINHITNHQEFLCRKMGFRKANCKLHIVYRPKIKLAVNMIWPFRHILRKMDNVHPLLHQINGVIKLETIRRGR